MAKRALLILDACVLIDFWDTDPSLLTLVIRHVGAIHVAETVLSEAKSVPRDGVIEAGVIPVEPSFEVMSLAAVRRRGLSFADHVCLLLAKDGRWTCVTNDGRLRRACAEDAVSVLWGLELVLQLARSGGIDAKAAERVGQSMAAKNRYLTDAVLKNFEAKLRRLGK